MDELYRILGCDPSCTDEELSQSYLALRKQYQNDIFLEGEAGNEAARKLTQLNEAYNEVCAYRAEKHTGEGADAYAEVESFIKSGKINEAQAKLDCFNERTAEWHYLQSVVFYRKNWVNESKKQLEIAMQMDGGNQKYKTAYDKLCAKMAPEGNTQKDKNWNKSGSNGGAHQTHTNTYEEPTEMMGGDSCADFCCRMAICNILLNCCCNCR